MATLSPSEIAYQKAHVHDDKRWGITVSDVVCIVVAAVAVLLRFISRRLAGAEHRGDDWWIWTALVRTSQSSTVVSTPKMTIDFLQFIYTGYVVGCQFLVHYGMGRHSILMPNIKGFVVVSISLSLLGFGRLLTPTYVEDVNSYFNPLQLYHVHDENVNSLLLSPDLPSTVVQIHLNCRWYYCQRLRYCPTTL